MANVPNFPHLNGKTFRYGAGRPDTPASERTDKYISEGGTMIAYVGDRGRILEGFTNWNGVEGLIVFWVQMDSGVRTHLGLSEIDFRSSTGN